MLLEQHGVHRLALGGRDVPEQVADQQAAGRERQRDGHVDHRALAGLHARLAHDGQAVGDGLDAGVGAAAHRVGPAAAARPCRRSPGSRRPARSRSRTLAAAAGICGACARMPPTMPSTCVARKRRKTGSRTITDSRTPRMLSTVRPPSRTTSVDQLRAVPAQRQEAEEGVAGRGDRDGDGQHVVDQQRAAGDDADVLAQQLGRHDVAAAAVGELLDDAPVGRGDDEDGAGRHHGQRQQQVGVLAEGAEGLVGAVGGRREAVGAQADPGEERHQRQAVEERAVGEAARPAEEEPPRCGSRTTAARRRDRDPSAATGGYSNSSSSSSTPTGLADGLGRKSCPTPCGDAPQEWVPRSRQAGFGDGR